MQGALVTETATDPHGERERGREGEPPRRESVSSTLTLPFTQPNCRASPRRGGRRETEREREKERGREGGRKRGREGDSVRAEVCVCVDESRCLW